MQPAPAVSVEWRTGSAWIVAALLLAAAALVSSLLWASGVGGLGWLLPAASLVLAVASLWPLRPQPVQRLRWDGQTWWLAATAASTEAGGEAHGEVRLMVDLELHLLLRFEAAEPGRQGRCRWLPLSRTATSGDWHGLRCALLYCSGDVGVMPAAADPPP